MGNFILVDDDNIVRCIATHESNLHKDKLHMKKYYTEVWCRPGDEYDSKTDTVTPRPENYPAPNTEELIEIRKSKIIRDQAIQELKDEGKIPIDYRGE
jgi:hypothetical protein